MLSEHIKVQLCSFIESYKNQQGFSFHQPASHFLFAELLWYKKEVIKKSACDRSRNKVKCNNYSIGILNKLCSELHPTYHNDNFIKSRD